MSIQEFLLAQVRGDDLEGLRAEVQRHGERTMTVVHRDRLETITRCGACSREGPRPCTGLRDLAQPFADHPDFREEWRALPAQ